MPITLRLPNSLEKLDKDFQLLMASDFQQRYWRQLCVGQGQFNGSCLMVDGVVIFPLTQPDYC